MIQALLAGLVLGGIYALASGALVITYQSSGILNFAFGSMAYFLARFYYFLNTQHKWSIPLAAIVSVLLAGPLMGVFLYAVLLRFLRQASSLIKVVATIGLSVALPVLAVFIFGNPEINLAPGLAPRPVRIFHLAGVPISLDNIIVYACVVVMVAAGALLLRYTQVGLLVRATVDSEAMTSLSGANPERVVVGVWAVSTFLAGLAGILAAPIVGLGSVDSFTLLIAAAFAAVVAARLRSLAVAVTVSLLMGITGAIIELYLPPTSSVTAEIIPSIPFAFIVLFLVFQMIRSGRVSENVRLGGALDRAIRPAGGSQLANLAAKSAELRQDFVSSYARPGVAFLIVLVAPLLLHGLWRGLLGEGLAYGLCFMSFTLVTGEGGMIWLCQITFAGIGAITTAQLATVHHWPLLFAIVAGSLITLLLGAFVGLLTVRLGDLYVALITLTFGLLIQTDIFTNNPFYQFGTGVNVSPPHFAQSPFVLDYLMIGVFLIVSLMVSNLRRSTTGMAINAVRWSPSGSRTTGLSVVQMKVLVSALAAMVAGLGGGFVAVFQGAALPDSYSVLIGLVWFAVLATVGIRSNVAAAFAGFGYTFLPAIFLNYLPANFAQFPTLGFGSGAVLVARNPDGVLAMHARQLTTALTPLMARWRGRSELRVHAAKIDPSANPTSATQSLSIPYDGSGPSNPPLSHLDELVHPPSHDC